MTQATFIIWPTVYRTSAIQSMISIAKDYGVHFENIFLDGSLHPDDHAKLVRQQKNTIAWTSHGVPYDLQRYNTNILFLENGPLLRNRTIFVDENGFGDKSNVVLRKYNVATSSKHERDELLRQLEIDKYDLDYKPKNNKICMIALQGFKDHIILKSCIQFLPKCEKVIVRGHPAKKEACEAIFAQYCANLPNWEYDTIESANESLARCEALITHNSSLMYRAMLMGVKVSTCSQGFHTGSYAVLNCARDHRLLGKTFLHQNKYEDILNLLCGIQKSVLFAHATQKVVAKYTSFANWLIRLKP